MKPLAKVFCFTVRDAAQQVIDLGLANSFITGLAEFETLRKGWPGSSWLLSVMIYEVEAGCQCAQCANYDESLRGMVTWKSVARILDERK